MKTIALFSCLFVCAFALSGCLFPPRVKEGLVVNHNLNKAQIKNIAKNSKNIFEFTSNIYTENLYNGSANFVSTKEQLVEKYNYDLIDNNIYSTYCNEKNGSLQEWHFAGMERQSYEIRGMSKEIIACEVGSEIESVMINEEYSRDSKYYPYVVYTTYGNKNYFLDFIQKKYLYGFESSNGIITFPRRRVTDPDVKSPYAYDLYNVNFNYSNNSKIPVDINILSSYVKINGTKYDMVFNFNKNGEEYVDWEFWSRGIESRGVFKDDGTLKLNPGQKLKGSFAFKIPGRTQITENDLKHTIFYIDGIECKNFKKVDYFSQNKKPLIESN